MAKRKSKKTVEAEAADATADAAEAPDTAPVELIPVESKVATLSRSAIVKDGGDPGLLGFDAPEDDRMEVEDDEPVDPGPAPVTKAKITTKARRVGNGKGAKRK